MSPNQDPPYLNDERPLYEERRPDNRGLITALVVVLVALAALGYWYWRGRRPAPPPAAEAPATAPAPPAAAAPAAESGLPPLGASDELVRRLAAELSARPALAQWLAHDDLVRRFAASVVAVAEGSSPRPRLKFLVPEPPFDVERTGEGSATIAPGSFHRYDTVAAVFASLDTEGTAELLRRLHPLLDEAYAEIGDPESSFDATLARAIARLRAVPVPEPPYLVIPQEGTWAWADRELEQRPVAEKLLLRMGPDNQRLVQRKLGELAAALGLPASS